MQTADRLAAAGKPHWFEARDTMVAAKGKGQLQTYWLKLVTSSDEYKSDTASSAGSANDSFFDEDSGDLLHLSLHNPDFNNKVSKDASTLKAEAQNRQVNWMVETLVPLLKKIVAMRGDGGNDSDSNWKRLRIATDESSTVLDEVKEIITLPTQVTDYVMDPASIELDAEVVSQVRLT